MTHLFVWGRALSARIPLKQKVRLESILLVLLVVAAYLVRIWGVSRMHYWDEMVYLQNAQVICCGKGNYSELDFRPPLISVLYAGVFLLWNHIYAACAVAAFLNALGPLFLYRAGRLLSGTASRFSAAIAAVLLAFSPFFVGVFPDGFVSDDTGNSLLTDSPALTLVLLAFWLMLRALKGERAGETTGRVGRRHGSWADRNFGWAGLVLALSILMRFGSIPSVGMLFLLPLISARRWRALLACGVGFVGGMAPYLLWSKVQYGQFFLTLRAGWTAVEGPTESRLFYFRNATTIFTPLALAGVLLAAGWSLWHLYGAVRSRSRIAGDSFLHRRAVLLYGYLWLWLVADLTFFSIMPHKEPRYILPLAPPLLLLAGLGLSLLCAWRRRPLHYAGALLVVVSIIFTVLPSWERFSGPFLDPAVQEEMLASDFLRTAIPASATLYMNFNYPAFAYYSNYNIHVLHVYGAALDSEIDQIPLGGILIVYRTTEEVREPGVERIDANPRFQRIRDFNTFVVYRSVGGIATHAK